MISGTDPEYEGLKALNRIG